jgi:fructoselysine-6-P-deglycase FrlB-like protein
MSDWISHFREDVYSQVKYLRGLRLPKPMKIRSGLFVGAGDSYICALLLEYLSKHSVLAYHPSDILRSPEMLLDHEIFFVSASGRTQSNIEAAKIAQRFGLKTTAITARPKSILEGICRKTLNPGYLHNVQSSNTGILDFTATVISCMALIGIKINMNILSRIMSDAREQIHQYGIDLPRKFQSILFLGNGTSYPIASYGAFKMHEFFGAKSFGYLLDDYYHSPIFSLKKSDHVFILGQENSQDPISAEFNCRLQKIHPRSYYFQPKVGRSNFEQVIFSIFIIQVLVLRMAENLRIDKPYYLSNKRMLNLSSSLIY